MAIIPALEKVAEAARKLIDHQFGCAMSSKHQPETCVYCVLTAALSDLNKAREDSKKRHSEALISRGIDCIECGRRFLPLPDDYSNCCSIGCRFK